MNGATLFAGFEGVGVGMRAAGIKHAWGIEYDPAIATVAQLNGFNTVIADILDCDPADFERVDFLHASPPCPNFSNAKANGEETELDIALARKVAEFITVLLPDYFTLENVYQYRTSQSWGIIAQALMTHGYAFNYWHCNMADYGVPQTRKRMIVIARRDGLRPQLPPATHAENPEVGLFGTLKPWVGWYEAIADLIPSLPESKFAKWQLSRLPDELRTMLLTNGQYDNQIPTALECEPANAITANENQGSLKALIVDGRNSNQQWGKLYREGEEPATAVTSLERPAHLPRAFIVDGKLSTSGDEKKLQINDQDNPSGTVVSSHSAFRDARAFIMNAANPNGNEKRKYRDIDEPAKTMTASDSLSIRAYASGRIVQMTPRALARFQSFPDSYQLPENKQLACRGIGNALPPLFMEQLLREVMQSNP